MPWPRPRPPRNGSHPNRSYILGQQYKWFNNRNTLHIILRTRVVLTQAELTILVCVILPKS